MRSRLVRQLRFNEGEPLAPELRRYVPQPNCISMAIKLTEQMLRKIVREEIIKEAGREHRRLKKDLEEFAHDHGFADDSVDFYKEIEPDVLKNHSTQNYLLVGDAKDANHERVTHSATRRRVNAYLAEFGRRLEGGEIDGGIIVIATNDETAADDWKSELPEMCKMNNIYSPSEEALNFQSTKDGETWFVYG